MGFSVERRSIRMVALVLGLALLSIAAVKTGAVRAFSLDRSDRAWPLEIPLEGSLQNPAWSPDGQALVFTRFRDGYNQGPADLFIYDFDTNSVRPLVMDGSVNVNLPGSAWSSANGFITFSSDRGEHDEIYIISAEDGPGDEVQLTSRENRMAYEPAFSRDGRQVVFETHPLDVEGQGVITIFALTGDEGYQQLTSPPNDCRQPNWSSRGDIVFQCMDQDRWDLWVNNQRVTNGEGDKTDASFSYDGLWIVFSSDQQELEYANLFILPVEGGRVRRITYFEGYDGAPSWSPSGDRIAFESYPGDPDDSAGTTLWVIDVSKFVFFYNKTK
jgi:TolB protein